MSGGELIYNKWNREENEKKILRFIKRNEDIPQEVVDRLIEVVCIMRLHDVCVNRADYLISGDDGYESFLNRWREDLSELESIDKFIYQIENGEIDESDED